MKIKGKVNLSGIKSALVVHGEKFAFGLAGFCLLIFAYAALTRETLGVDRQPLELLREATEAENKMDAIKTPPETFKADFTDRSKKKLPVPKFAAVLINAPVIDPKVKRPDPDLLPVEELRVTAGVGTFAVKAAAKKKSKRGEAEEVADQPQGALAPLPPGFQIIGLRPTSNAVLKRFYYTVVTGIVPLRKQALHYEATFQNAEGYLDSPKMPQYVDFRLERMDLPGGQWTEVDLAAARALARSWSADLPDVIPPDAKESGKFVASSYLAPLPSIVGAEWDEHAAHPPQIRYMRPGRPGVVEEGGPSAPAAETSPVTNEFTGERTAVSVDNRLFRFFDFNVNPEKQYRYRVRLVLKNPNFKLAPRLLKNAKSAEAETVETPFSEPTPLVTVPIGGSMYVGPVVPGKGSAEAAAKVLVSVVDSKSALEASVEIDAPRGMLLNRPTQSVRAIDWRGGIRNLEAVTFQTNCVLLDFQGGAPFNKEKEKEGDTIPGEVLIASLDDSLSVASEVEDSRQYKAKLVPPPAEVHAGVASGGKPFKDDPLFSSSTDSKKDKKDKNAKAAPGAVRQRPRPTRPR